MVEERRYVPGTLSNRHDLKCRSLKCRRSDTIDDQVGSDWPKQHSIPRQIFPLVTEIGVLGEGLKGVEKFLNPPIRSSDAVPVGVVPKVM